MNGTVEYKAELLTEGVDANVKDFLETAVVAEAKKVGVFEVQGR
jgi:hypothetical protein